MENCLHLSILIHDGHFLFSIYSPVTYQLVNFYFTNKALCCVCKTQRYAATIRFEHILIGLTFVESTVSSGVQSVQQTFGAVTPQEPATFAFSTDIEGTPKEPVSDVLTATYKPARVVFVASRDLVTPLQFEQTVYVATFSENR